ncbi:MAG: hypothetical protein GY851_04750 [bacterium]|nr:hypothetical protein [bacterium]
MCLASLATYRAWGGFMVNLSYGSAFVGPFAAASISIALTGASAWICAVLLIAGRGNHRVWRRVTALYLLATFAALGQTTVLAVIGLPIFAALPIPGLACMLTVYAAIQHRHARKDRKDST